MPWIGFTLGMAVFVPASLRVACATFVGSSMTALVLWIFVQPRSRWASGLLAGALGAAAAFGTLFTIVYWPLPVLPFLLIGTDLVFSLYLIAIILPLGLTPLIGTAIYATHARRAWVAARDVSRPVIAIGFLVPFVLAASLQLSASHLVDLRIELMLAEDHVVALETARRSRWIPLADWTPLVDAWLSSKSGTWASTENERSNRIADVYLSLTGTDLRDGY